MARNWMTDWSEAARRPWRARMFLLVGFALVGLMVSALVGDLHPWWVPCAAAAAFAAIGVLSGEGMMRTSAGRQPSVSQPRDRTVRLLWATVAFRLLWVTVAFLAGAVVAAVTGSGVIGVLTLLGVVFAAIVGLRLVSR